MPQSMQSGRGEKISMNMRLLDMADNDAIYKLAAPISLWGWLL